MKYGELTRKLGRLGIVFRRQAGGSHEIWRDPANGFYTVIPRHASREIRIGTLAKILRDLGLTREDIDRV